MKKKPISQKETANKINEILLKANIAQNKKEKEKSIELIKKYSTDYSNPIAFKSSPEEFLNKDLQYASLKPESFLSGYYKEKLPNEIVSAGSYNAANPVITPQSFSQIFDYIPARKSNVEFSSYHVPNKLAGRNPMVVLTKSGELDAMQQNLMTRWIESEDPDKKRIASSYFQQNSLIPSFGKPDLRSSLEHEVGHHIARIDPSSSIAKKAEENARIASNGFKEFGEHTGKPSETIQALARFQREWFKENNNRITNPNDFLSIVNSGNIPKFLSEEGKRILIYAGNLKKVANSNESKEKKKAAEEALKAISEMLPAVVQNQKQYGLKLNIA